MKSFFLRLLQKKAMAINGPVVGYAGGLATLLALIYLRIKKMNGEDFKISVIFISLRLFEQKIVKSHILGREYSDIHRGES